MSHQVETMFSVQQTPWHKLGNIIPDSPTVEEGLIAAGLNWNVITKPLFTADGLIVPSKATIRDTDNSVLGVVGNKYNPLQNSEAFKWFNPFLEAKLAKLETGGSLWNGRQVWVLAKLNKAPIEVGKGDEVNKYLLLSNSHDGKMAVRVGFTPIRVVCNNTLTLSHNSSQSQLIRVVHSSKVVENLDNLKEIINAVDAKFEATAEQYKYLASKQINKSDLENFVKTVFFHNGISDSTRTSNKLTLLTNRITELFEKGRGNDLQSIKGTYWALYNSATEYLSYDISRTEDRRLHNLWFGDGKKLNELAFTTALDLAS